MRRLQWPTEKLQAAAANEQEMLEALAKPGREIHRESKESAVNGESESLYSVKVKELNPL